MNSKLTQFEIKDLIFRYNSELRKLEFQIHKTKETLLELQNELNSISVATESSSRMSSGASNTPTETTIKSYQTLIKDIADDKEVERPKRGRPRKYKPEFEFPQKEVPTYKPTNEDATPNPAKKRGRPRKIESVPSPLSNPEKVGSSTKGYRLSEWDKFIIESLEDANRVLINSDFLSLAKIKVERSNSQLTEDELKGKLTRSIHKLANKRGEIIKIDFSGKGYAYALKDWINPKGMLKRKYGN